MRGSNPPFPLLRNAYLLRNGRLWYGAPSCYVTGIAGMALSNAERQKRHRERLKAKAAMADAGSAPLDLRAAWDAATDDERAALIADVGLSKPLPTLNEVAVELWNEYKAAGLADLDEMPPEKIAGLWSAAPLCDLVAEDRLDAPLPDHMRLILRRMAYGE